MKKSGFSMIELIFAIVIIGILAAVALPRLSEMGESAKKSKFAEFVGTLNTSVGPQMWAKVATDATAKGSIKALKLFKTAANDGYIELPAEWKDNGVNLASCGAAPKAGDVGTFANIGKVTVSGTDMDLFCRDGSPTDQPRFAVDSDGKVTF